MESKTASVLRTLRAEIVSGELPGGTRLKEDVIAARFGVSRVPVREALRQLESEGFALAEKYRGVTVAEASAESVIELMQIRRQLEGLAARLAAKRRGGESSADLKVVVELAREATPPVEPLIEFHHLVAGASGNRQLESMIERVIQQTAWAFERRTQDALSASLEDHAAIAAAILRGSETQASVFMDEHLSKDEEWLRAGRALSS
ncbi:GntR family transcriptional regulator [Frondihabitans australicus]|uniref:GntR family transcriptional regulator n=1 Tax=Frondihabitans australicus TaxID=386892 RepID=UPI001475142B|nr:GntR family transcriptional regulator [Frondihabitans australicus]